MEGTRRWIKEVVRQGVRKKGRIKGGSRQDHSDEIITYESGTIMGTLYRGLDSFLYCIGFRISQGRTGTPVKKENSLQNIFLGRKFLSLLVKSLLYGVQGQKYFVISKIAASTKINKKIIFVLQYLYTIDSKAEMHITFVSSELCQFFQPLHSILLSCLV